MFKLNETYFTPHGQSVRIVCVNSGILHGTAKIPCPLVGVLTNKGAKNPTAVQYYDDKGRYCGMTSNDYAQHSLISNEPDEAEAKLITEIRCLVTDPNSRDADERMLKVIRQLRK